MPVVCVGSWNASAVYLDILDYARAGPAFAICRSRKLIFDDGTIVPLRESPDMAVNEEYRLADEMRRRFVEYAVEAVQSDTPAPQPQLPVEFKHLDANRKKWTRNKRTTRRGNN